MTQQIAIDFGDGTLEKPAPIVITKPRLPRTPRKSRPHKTKAHLAQVAGQQVRLRGQADQILARLESGPATNAELAELSLKYTGRLSDLRARGHKIQCEQNYTTGVSIYTLKKD